MRTSIYRQSRSEKLVIMVVMKGWPATAESVFRSFLICSTCFKRMTAEPESTFVIEENFAIHLLSTLRSIFRAKTFCPSFGEPAKRDSHTRAKVPGQIKLSKLPKIHINLTSPNSLDQFKVSHSQLLRCRPNLFTARVFRNLTRGKRRPIALEASYEILLLLFLFLVNWLFIGQAAAVGAEQFMAVRSVEVGFEFRSCHLDAQQAKSSWNDAWRILEIGNGLRWQDCR